MIHTPESHAARVAQGQKLRLRITSGCAHHLSLRAAEMQAAGLDATAAHRAAADAHEVARSEHEKAGTGEHAAHREAFLSHLAYADPAAHAHLTKAKP